MDIKLLGQKASQSGSADTIAYFCVLRALTIAKGFSSWLGLCLWLWIVHMDGNWVDLGGRGVIGVCRVRGAAGAIRFWRAVGSQVCFGLTFQLFFSSRIRVSR